MFCLLLSRSVVFSPIVVLTLWIMKEMTSRLKYLALMLLPLLVSCFTGIENTGRISDRTVAKVKANKTTEEEAFFDTVQPQPFAQWRKGKQLHVASNDIRLVLRPAADSLKGKTFTYVGTETLKEIDNTDEVVMLFTSDGTTYRYETDKTIGELNKLKADYIVPFLTDLDYVARVDSMLRGKKLYLKTSVWRLPNGEVDNGLRYVPVVVTNVAPGDAVYPFYVAFDYEGRKSGVFMSSSTSSVKNMTFDKLFSFTDIRNSHKQISDENWEQIIRGKVVAGMTKEECTLALGAPQSVERIPTHAGLVERWVYDNGVYLIFADGVLERFRQ